MEAKLYVILGSHACRTGMLLLEHKGISYEAVTLATGLHPLLLRLHGFAGNPSRFRLADEGGHHLLGAADRMGTVPALRLDGERVKTNRRIARFLEEVRPEPPLFPEDPELRRRVEEAELWGDDELQMTARRLIFASVLHGPDAVHDRGSSGRLGPLLWRNEWVRFYGSRAFGRVVFGATAELERELLDSLPAMLDRVDAWIEGGVLNGERLYVADMVIAPSLALLTYRNDLRDELERRPLLGLVDRLLPEPAVA